MKTKSFFLLCVLFASLEIGAQEYKKFQMAFLLSPQLSWIKSDSKAIETSGNRFGYNFGISLNRYFAPNYAINTGLTINTTGGSFEYEDQSGKVTETIHLKYIEIPFGINLKSNDTRRVVYWGQFGLASQFNIKATDDDDNSISKHINLIDLSYHFGGGIDYSLGGNNYLKMGLIFNNGITDITDDDYLDDKTILNRLVFQVGLVF